MQTFIVCLLKTHLFSYVRGGSWLPLSPSPDCRAVVWLLNTHKLREKVEVETVTDAMHTRSKGVTAYHHTHHCLSKGLSSIPVFLNCCHSWHSLCMHVSYSIILTYMLVAPSPVHLHFYSLWSLTCAKV